jgi:hypothetical protein
MSRLPANFQVPKSTACGSWVQWNVSNTERQTPASRSLEGSEFAFLMGQKSRLGRKAGLSQGSTETKEEQVGKHRVTSSFYVTTLRRKEGKLMQLSRIEAWGMCAKQLKWQKKNCMWLRKNKGQLKSRASIVSEDL